MYKPELVYYNYGILTKKLKTMQSVNITLAKSHLSSLLKKIEEKNEEIIIERAGKPIARLIKYKPIKNIDRLGGFIDKIKLSEDFDEWPNDIAIKLGIKD